MSDSDPGQATTVAALGAGLIGRSWIALFVANGLTVRAYDTDPNAEDLTKAAITSAWPTLVQLGLGSGEPRTDAVTFFDDSAEAVAGAGFVQESVPERIEIKHDLYRRIEPLLDPHAIVASSASGLTLSEMQQGWQDPSRFVLGHPFNPPHLIPLVEVMGNDATAPGVVDDARAFYESIGKVTIEVKKEVPGHVANRLQAALWREAIHLVLEGVASVEDVDTAVASGPGQRWAVMGPTRLFHLGADDAGLTAFCERYSVSFNRWWDDLGDPRLTDQTSAVLIDGIAEATAGSTVAELTEIRDQRLAEVIKATHPDLGSTAR